MSEPIKVIEIVAKEWIKEEKSYSYHDILDMFEYDDSLISQLARRCIRLEDQLNMKLPSIVNIEEARKGCHLTYNGGWKDKETIEAFHHGMDTVFNVFETEAENILKRERERKP